MASKLRKERVFLKHVTQMDYNDNPENHSMSLYCLCWSNLLHS